MDLPTDNDTFTYSNEIDIPHSFFVGQCFYCQIFGAEGFGTIPRPLLRCGGCRLVVFCRKECQKLQWVTHKYACKEFPVVDGKSVLHTTGPWEKHISALLERATRLRYPSTSTLPFLNPRVCHSCREATPDNLTDCKCACVSYCSNKCSEADKQHQATCSLLGKIAQCYSLVLPNHDMPLNDRILTFPVTLLYAFQSLGTHCFGRDHLPIKDITTLNIHILTRWPMFYAQMWHSWMDWLPKLRKLNLVFVMQAKALHSSFNFNYNLSGIGCSSSYRCQHCSGKNPRDITLSVQQMLYHRFFSSPQYTVPDVVVVYDNIHEMSTNHDDNPHGLSAIYEDDNHSKKSYRNMIHSPDTVLILTGASKVRVAQGVIDVNNAQPADLLGTAKSSRNPLVDPGAKHYLNGDGSVYHHDEISYFTCLRRSLKC